MSKLTVSKCSIDLPEGLQRQIYKPDPEIRRDKISLSLKIELDIRNKVVKMKS